ncbi:cytidine deaminase-like protein [Gigaspora margarita]|uniref:dCMP deaminase n=1 Tax=Gigaspora margarita TaxID=4874 RepID=A0A8H4AMS7_GIGMA|nr:cytidine deaminase-like protein [Gigaspora margarita]
MLVGIIGSEFSQKDRCIKFLKDDHGFKELKRDVGEKLDKLKRDVGEKSDKLKRDVGEKLDELKRDVGEQSDELKRDVGEKLDEFKRDVGEKLDEFKRDIGEKSDELKKRDVGEKSDELKRDVGEKSDELIKIVKKNWKTKYVIEVKTEEELYEYKKCALFLLLAVDDALSTRYDKWVDQNKKNVNAPQALKANTDVSAFLQKIDDDKKKNYKLMSMADFTMSIDKKADDVINEEILEILKKPLRSPKNDYFMYLAELTASGTNCMSRKVGCILVKDDYRVIATGYNGTPTNIYNCIEGHCECCRGIKIEGRDNCICMHAEENALLIAGMEAQGCTLYCTTSPCLNCSKKIIQSKVKKVVYYDPYKDLEKVEELFREANKNAKDKRKVKVEDEEEFELIPHSPQTKNFKLYPLKDNSKLFHTHKSIINVPNNNQSNTEDRHII